MIDTRKAIFSMLQEGALPDKFITQKAEEQGIKIHRIKQDGLVVKIRLELPADENAIRRLKTQLRIQNPNLERIEVRQPLGYVKEPEADLAPQTDAYQAWRQKMIKQLYQISRKFGWEFFTNPKASVNTEYFFMQTGQGANRKIVKIRMSDHPSWKEDTDISLDMTEKESTIDDLKIIMKNKVRPNA